MINGLTFLIYVTHYDISRSKVNGCRNENVEKMTYRKMGKNDKLSLISVTSTNCTTFIPWYVITLHVSIMLYSGKIRTKPPLYRILEIYSRKRPSLNGIYLN